MIPFTYTRPDNIEDAVRAASSLGSAARFIAGGTNLVDLMKEHIEQPAHLIDVTHLPLKQIEDANDGGLILGALTTNSQVAYDERIQSRYPLLASAIRAGASAQLRNVATTGGNLLQRTRCFYFYDTAVACNKREPGSGCAAMHGKNRIHAILGASDQCIATHPSDMCVALAALQACVQVTGPQGTRSIAFADFHRLPGDQPDQDTTLRAGELITAITLPAENFAANYTYLKLRDRLSYAFALVSVAAAMHIENGLIAQARLALGGVAHRPWREPEAEHLLIGKAPDRHAFGLAADRILIQARGHGDNDFKIPLARRAIVRALEQAAAGIPQSPIDKRIN
ncbi:FAD-binding molybdopterin dehydrogenase [Advenella sp. S44]|uniref:FAD binding domain-containing protein n=1 Tax=Advenella sp. S44 TaxID=1982755 RepID=UPI000C2A9448|nr:xanthine dehydrogenase family protein subunit M [Advenella sp. S44]PJX26077.1 FAD-binding molybdopterin dehydrogenase [Advenella sp. S44]